MSPHKSDIKGYLPEDIGNSMMIETLDLRRNLFEGSIPKSYKNLVKLMFLGLSWNNLTGRIPWEIGELSILETIVIGHNELEGGIPDEIGNLPNLNYLDLAIGNLGVRIPNSIGKLQKIDTFFLYQNSLEGPIPSSIGNLTLVQLLDMSNDMLSRIIPSEIGNFNNGLTGTILDEFWTCMSLVHVRMHNIFISGTIHIAFGKHGKLQRLELTNNHLTGQIPNEFASSVSLYFIDALKNGLQLSLSYFPFRTYKISWP